MAIKGDAILCKCHQMFSKISIIATLFIASLQSAIAGQVYPPTPGLVCECLRVKLQGKLPVSPQWKTLPGGPQYGELQTFTINGKLQTGKLVYQKINGKKELRCSLCPTRSQISKMPKNTAIYYYWDAFEKDQIVSPS